MKDTKGIDTMEKITVRFAYDTITISPENVEFLKWLIENNYIEGGVTIEEEN